MSHPEGTRDGPDTTESGDVVAKRLLEVARDLAVSLHPHRRTTLRVDLDSTLDRDLGLDSLGRVELLLRVERTFKVRLDEQLLIRAQTLHELLDAVRQSGRKAPAAMPSTPTLALEPLQATPAAARTLLEVLDWHVATHPDRPHIVLEDSDEGSEVITYGALRQRALAVAGGLHGRGLQTGQSVAIMLPTCSDFFAALFGILYAGGVPVPIYPPFRPAQLEEHLRRQAGILSNAEARILVTTEEGRRVARLVRGLAGTIETVGTVGDLSAAAGDLPATARSADDVALVQYTSGSTGDPKGVVLTHANLLANIRAIGETMQVDSTDVFVSWLPLYHDMGLIGAWLGSLYFAVLAVIMSPLRFLARPERWLWAIHRHHATLSAAPNFAYELCLRKIDDADISGLDLGSWRMAINGAEPVSPETIRGFTTRFSRFGFHPESMTPVYGLAECSVGLSFPPPGRIPIIDRVQRAALVRSGNATPAPADDTTALEFVACGHALPRHEIRIIDAAGRELADRREGRLQFRGPSATGGYLRNPTKTAELLSGAWLESGDLAYTATGDIYLTGRSKDIIIRAGRNIYPHEVEQAIGNLPGIRRGCVVAFGSHDRATGTERLIIVAETRIEDAQERAVLRRKVDDLVTGLLDTGADDVVLAPPHTVLKTSSGKIRRAACRELYEIGRLGEHAPPVWWQAVRLYVRSLRERSRQVRPQAGALLYAGYWWSLLYVLGAVTWTLVAVLPGRNLRWRIVHGIARAFLRSAAIPILQTGMEHIPTSGAVLAANHASYFDGVVLAALLHQRPTFVAKRELASQFVAGVLLRRIGAVFAERVEPGGGIQSTDAALIAARSGQTLLFFPEGTLTRMPGILPFHTGAFYVAAQSGRPIVPVAIHGTRSILRGDQWFPRRGSVRVEIAPAVTASASSWDAVVGLRDAVRNEILRRMGEPDLVAQDIGMTGPPSA